ncbi:unnamed protein product [Lupinus luteus]|uniref:Uncharacterized protein n=1 Tax=Lupinus luteus TaxID=3873 RepID=A0AAV1XQM9_LUPLU
MIQPPFSNPSKLPPPRQSCTSHRNSEYWCCNLRRQLGKMSPLEAPCEGSYVEAARRRFLIYDVVFRFVVFNSPTAVRFPPKGTVFFHGVTKGVEYAGSEAMRRTLKIVTGK